MLTMLMAIFATSDTEVLYRQTPAPGLRRYSYEATETVAGGRLHGYHLDFDLQNSGREIYAIIRKSYVLDGSWKAVEPDAACRAAMHGDNASLARVKLSPLSSQASKTLGESFLSICAPAAIFFPLTDILNVVLIPSSRFRATELSKVGQSLSYAAFRAAFDRTGVAIKETSPGGEIVLASLDDARAVLDWNPRLADLQLVNKASVPPLALNGTEHFGFRVAVDRKSGMIESAETIYDDLDMEIAGAPETVPHVRITRAVRIEAH